MDSQLAGIIRRLEQGYMTKKEQREQEKQNAIVRLRELLPPGSTAFTILRHVSRSGMSRAISVVVDNQDISHMVAQATDYNLSKRHDGLDVGGCGMDLGFSIIYNLSRILFSNFQCIGEGNGYGTRCPPNDHNNGDRNYETHTHSDGGYAISQRWL